MNSKTLLAFFLGTGIFSSFSVALTNTIPREVESSYSEAVLKYHERNYPEALSLLDSALKINPTVTPILELKALVLKSSGEFDKAYDTYRKLSTSAAKAPKGEELRKNVYLFEMGMIRFQQGKYADAVDPLTKAMEADVNPIPARYALGVIHLKESRPEDAEVQFTQVIASEIPEWKAPAYLNLAQISGLIGDSRGAIRDTIRARRVAATTLPQLPANSDGYRAVEQVLTTTDKFLAGMRKPSYYAQVGLAGGYDSNVLLIPTLSLNSSEGVSKRSSLKTNIFWSLGYQSVPLESKQFSLNYNGAANYNFNQDTRAGQYFSHTVSGQFTPNALAPLSYGAKLEAIYTMRYGDDTSATPNRFSSYNVVGVVGPFIRYESAPRSVMGAELLFTPQRYFQDETSDPAYRLTGLAGQGRFFYQKQTYSAAWNPKVSLLLDWRQPIGQEFRSKGASIELQDSMRLADRLNLISAVNVALSMYTEATSGFRRDVTLTGSISAQYSLTRNIALTSSLQYTDNRSSVIDTYEFKRIAATFGGTYLF